MKKSLLEISVSREEQFMHNILLSTIHKETSVVHNAGNYVTGTMAGAVGLAYSLSYFMTWAAQLQDDYAEQKDLHEMSLETTKWALASGGVIGALAVCLLNKVGNRREVNRLIDQEKQCFGVIVIGEGDNKRYVLPEKAIEIIRSVIGYDVVAGGTDALIEKYKKLLNEKSISKVASSFSNTDVSILGAVFGAVNSVVTGTHAVIPVVTGAGIGVVVGLMRGGRSSAIDNTEVDRESINAFREGRNIDKKCQIGVLTEAQFTELCGILSTYCEKNCPVVPEKKHSDGVSGLVKDGFAACCTGNRGGSQEMSAV